MYIDKKMTQVLDWWLELPTLNKDVRDSIFHASVVLTTLVHPTIVRGSCKTTPRALYIGRLVPIARGLTSKKIFFKESIQPLECYGYMFENMSKVEKSYLYNENG